MLAHRTSNGCNLATGDLIGSGTASGSTDESRACLSEIAAGKRPVEFRNGESRVWLHDGDVVVFRARAEPDGCVSIGFGECQGRVLGLDWNNKEDQFRMARKLVDISVPLQAGIASDPPHALPEIEYRDHHMTAPAIATYFGVSLDQLPQGEYAAVEKCRISTHNCAHLGSPYHFFSSMNHALKPPPASRASGSTRCRWNGAFSRP
jgi:hypothetical protein